MTGAKIVQGLRDAIKGNLSRVTIEGQTWQRVEKFDDATKKHLRAIHAICELAVHNFPGNTEISISANGSTQGRVCVPWYVIANLLPPAQS